MTLWKNFWTNLFEFKFEFKFWNFYWNLNLNLNFLKNLQNNLGSNFWQSLRKKNHNIYLKGFLGKLMVHEQSPNKYDTQPVIREWNQCGFTFSFIKDGGILGYFPLLCCPVFFQKLLWILLRQFSNEFNL